MKKIAINMPQISNFVSLLIENVIVVIQKSLLE